MKNKTSLKMRAGITAFFKVLWVFIKIILVCSFLLSFPVLGYLHSGKAEMFLGLIFSWFSFYAGKHVYKSIKSGTVRGLLISLVEDINIANYSVLTMSLILLIFAIFFSDDVKRITLASCIYNYYCIIIPIAVAFGIFMGFGYEELQDVFRKENDMCLGNCDKDGKESWKKTKFHITYFNPIILPFSVIVFSIRFLLKFIWIVVFSIKKLFLKKYQESVKK